MGPQGPQGPEGPQGPQGADGKATIVTQLSNPASTILLIDGKLNTTTASSYLQAREGVDFVKITAVAIKAVRVNGVSKLGEYIPVSINFVPDNTVPYSDNKLTFTLLEDKIKLEEQMIEVDLNITINGNNYVETKTIIIQKSGGENAVHLELTNDMDSYSQFTAYDHKIDITTTAKFYNGTSEITPEKYSATYFNCAGSFVNGVLNVTSVDIIGDPTHVDITATYKGVDYTKTFTIVYSSTRYRLDLDPYVINLDNITEIKGKLYIDDVLKDKPQVNIHCYADDNNTPIFSTSLTNTFTVPVDTIKNITKNLRFTVSAGGTIVESESIGVVKNGKDGDSISFYQIEANHN